PLERLIGERIHVFFAHDVRADREYLAALCLDCRLRHRERFGFDISQDYLHALIGELVRKGQSHAARRTRHHSHFACEVLHSYPLKLRVGEVYSLEASPAGIVSVCGIFPTTWSTPVPPIPRWPKPQTCPGQEAMLPPAKPCRAPFSRQLPRPNPPRSSSNSRRSPTTSGRRVVITSPPPSETWRPASMRCSPSPDWTLRPVRACSPRKRDRLGGMTRRQAFPSPAKPSL